MNKKSIGLFICMLLGCVAAHAQEYEENEYAVMDSPLIFTRTVKTTPDYERSTYLNFYFSGASMKQSDFSKLNSHTGFGMNIGNTYYLNSKPISDLLYIGLDATWFDFSFTNYKIEHITDAGTDKFSHQQVELGVQVGPSLTIIPTDELNVNAYFRYAPTFSFLNAHDEFSGSFASLFVGGAAISYSFIGVGIEYRFGSAKYNAFTLDTDPGSLPKTSTTLGALRTYISFRF